jgi:hypothetical protein
MADRFPKKYTVNHVLPHTVYEHHSKPCKAKGKTNTNRVNPDNVNDTPLRHWERADDPPAKQTVDNSQPLEYANTDETNLQPPF